jgi:hypothetical protein
LYFKEKKCAGHNVGLPETIENMSRGAIKNERVPRLSDRASHLKIAGYACLGRTQ